MKFALLVALGFLAIALALPVEDAHHRKHTRKPHHHPTHPPHPTHPTHPTPGSSESSEEASTPARETSAPEEGQSTAAPVEPSSPSEITTKKAEEGQTTPSEVVTSQPEEPVTDPAEEGSGNVEDLQLHKKVNCRGCQRHTRRPRPSTNLPTLPQENTTPAISTSAPEESSTQLTESAEVPKGFFVLW